MNKEQLRGISQKLRDGLATSLSGSTFHDTNILDKIDLMSDREVEIEYKKVKNINNDIFYFEA